MLRNAAGEAQRAPLTHSPSLFKVYFQADPNPFPGRSSSPFQPTFLSQRTQWPYLMVPVRGELSQTTLQEFTDEILVRLGKRYPQLVAMYQIEALDVVPLVPGAASSVGMSSEVGSVAPPREGGARRSSPPPISGVGKQSGSEGGSSNDVTGVWQADLSSVFRLDLTMNGVDELDLYFGVETLRSRSGGNHTVALLSRMGPAGVANRPPYELVVVWAPRRGAVTTEGTGASTSHPPQELELTPIVPQPPPRMGGGNLIHAAAPPPPPLLPPRQGTPGQASSRPLIPVPPRPAMPNNPYQPPRAAVAPLPQIGQSNNAPPSTAALPPLPKKPSPPQHVVGYVANPLFQPLPPQPVIPPPTLAPQQQQQQPLPLPHRGFPQEDDRPHREDDSGTVAPVAQQHHPHNHHPPQQQHATPLSPPLSGLSPLHHQHHDEAEYGHASPPAAPHQALSVDEPMLVPPAVDILAMLQQNEDSVPLSIHRPPSSSSISTVDSGAAEMEEFIAFQLQLLQVTEAEDRETVILQYTMELEIIRRDLMAEAVEVQRLLRRHRREQGGGMMEEGVVSSNSSSPRANSIHSPRGGGGGALPPQRVVPPPPPLPLLDQEERGSTHLSSLSGSNDASVLQDSPINKGHQRSPSKLHEQQHQQQPKGAAAAAGKLNEVAHESPRKAAVIEPSPALEHMITSAAMFAFAPTSSTALAYLRNNKDGAHVGRPDGHLSTAGAGSTVRHSRSDSPLSPTVLLRIEEQFDEWLQVRQKVLTEERKAFRVLTQEAKSLSRMQEKSLVDQICEEVRASSRGGRGSGSFEPGTSPRTPVRGSRPLPINPMSLSYGATTPLQASSSSSPYRPPAPQAPSPRQHHGDDVSSPSHDVDSSPSPPKRQVQTAAPPHPANHHHHRGDPSDHHSTPKAKADPSPSQKDETMLTSRSNVGTAGGSSNNGNSTNPSLVWTDEVKIACRSVFILETNERDEFIRDRQQDYTNLYEDFIVGRRRILLRLEKEWLHQLKSVKEAEEGERAEIQEVAERKLDMFLGLYRKGLQRILASRPVL